MGNIVHYSEHVPGCSAPNEYQRIEEVLKISHPKLYRNARREILVEEVLESLPGVSHGEALEAMKLY